MLVFGHHHQWDLDATERSAEYFGINPDDSEAFGAVVAAHENIVGYFAGHTHRNRIRRSARARHVPFVEVSCTKDYPGVWAEYRIYEDGFTQIVRRISAPAALVWTERTRPDVRRSLPRLRPGPARPPLLHPDLVTPRVSPFWRQ